MGFQFIYLQLTLSYFKGQGQCHVYFTSEYLENRDRYENRYCCSQLGSHVMAFDYHIVRFPFDLDPF